MKMKKYGILCLIVALITVLAIAIPVLATSGDVVYVKDGGTGNGSTPDAAMGDLFAAINALPDNGGTVVVCGDLTVTASGTKIWTWTAKTGKITVTGMYNGTDYAPTITFKGSKSVIEGASAIEFDNLTLDHKASASTEFYVGPSVTIGHNMTFLAGGVEIPAGYNSNNGAICFRMGNYKSVCADSYLEVNSGTFSYIQGGNNKQTVTKSTIVVNPGVTVQDFIQAGGTTKNVGTVDLTIDGANVGYLYLGGYGTAATTTNVTAEIRNTALKALYGQRYTAFQSLGCEGTVSGDLKLTLDNVSAGIWDLTGLTVSGQQELTVKNATDMTVADTLSGWDSLTLSNATVVVDEAYAGPATFTADKDSLLIVDDATASVPAGAQLESAAIVTVDGTNVADLAAAYTKLPAQGGIIRLATDVTVTLTSDEYYAWPGYVYSGTKTGPVTITSADPANPAVLALKSVRSTRSVISVRQTTKFSNLELRTQKNSSGGIQIFAGPSLTFGMGMTCTTNDGAAITAADTLGIRLGDHNTNYANRDSKFYMYSGTVNFIQGGNDRFATKNSTIYVGKDATVVDMIQCGGTNKAVNSATLTVEGAKINQLFLNGHNAGATMGSVTATIRNATVNSIDYHRTAHAAAACGSASLTLDNSTVGTLAGKDSRITSGGLTLRNYDCMTMGELSGWDSLTLDNAVVYLPNGYQGPATVTADGDSSLLVDAEDYATLPSVEGVRVAYWQDIAPQQTTQPTTTTVPETTTEAPETTTEAPETTTEAPIAPEGLTEVWLDQANGSDSNDGSAREKAVQTIGQAFALLRSGDAGTVHLVGVYSISTADVATNGMFQFPEHTAKVTIAGTDSSACFNFAVGVKTLVQFVSPVELKDLTWKYDHVGGNMDIYAGPEITVGENVTFVCTKHSSMSENCICIRGGYQAASRKSANCTHDNTTISVYSGTLSYVMGGNGATNVAGNATINIGGTAKIVARVMSAGANGGDVSGDVTINITGGEVNGSGAGYGLVLIGHGASGKECVVGGDLTVNISGGKVSQIVTTRTAYERLAGNLSVTISGTAEVSSINLNAAYMTADKKQELVFADNMGERTIKGGYGDGWDSIVIGENNTFYCYEAYTSTASLTVKAGSTLYLSDATNTTVPAYTSEGTGDNAGKVVLMKAPDHIHDGLGFAGEKWFTMNQSGVQGTAVYGDLLFQANSSGLVRVYNLASDTPGTCIAEFTLGSYNAGTLPSDPVRAEGTSAGEWANHSNQMMFGAVKFDESDPFPLLYVSSGNSGGHDGTGAYISKCAVERIRYDAATNTWSCETVQIIEFNDFDNIPDEIIDGVDVNPRKNQNVKKTTDPSEFLTKMRDPVTGKFCYISGNGYDASAGYQKVGWGWPASFVDSTPTAETAGKFYLKGARYRTYANCDPQNKAAYGNGYTNYAEENAYIITEFYLPALPTSEDDPAYGATVTLYPKDIIGQFETEYKIGGTQGGTLYKGMMYYPYGFNSGDNGLQIFDLEAEALVAYNRLGSMVSGEPECCAIYNGTLIMSDGSRNIWKFNMLMVDVPAKDAICGQPGNIAHAVCNLCDKKFSVEDHKSVLDSVEVPAPAQKHSMTYHAAVAGNCDSVGTLEHWSCANCHKNFADEAGTIVLDSVADTTDSHDFTKQDTDAKYLVSEANCHSPAFYSYSCTICGKAGGSSFPHGEPDKTNHAGPTEIRDAEPAQIGVAGYSGDKWCLGCNSMIEKGKDTDPLPDPEASLLDVVYLSGSGSDSNNGTTAVNAVATFGKAYELVKTGGTIILCGDISITVTDNYYLPEKAVTITGDVYNPVWTVESSKDAKAHVQFTAPTVLKNLTVNRGASISGAPGAKGTRCLELWTGPSLTLGEGMKMTNNGAALTYHSDGQVSVRTGHRTKALDSAALTMESGILSFIQGGNNAQAVGTSAITLKGSAVVQDMLQCGGTNRNVTASVVNISGNVSIDKLYVNGYGTATLGSSSITITGGTVNSINASRPNATGKITGNITMTIGGTAKVGALNLLDAEMKMEGTNALIFQDHSVQLTIGSGFGDGWDSITVGDNTVINLMGTYSGSGLTMEDGSVLYLNSENGINTVIPAYTKSGTAQTGRVELKEMHNITFVAAKEAGKLTGGNKEHYKCASCGKLFADAAATQEVTWEELYIQPTGFEYHGYVDGQNFNVTKLMTAAGGQGNAIFGNFMITANNVGSARLYDLTTGTQIAAFRLGSYNGGTLPDDPNVAAGTSAGNWTNHANQIMFGASKFDENDPFPLLYVTTGNSGGHDGTGAYISKCAVERILQNPDGTWYAEVVQIIEFNDYDCIPEQEGNANKNMNGGNGELTNMYNAETGRFQYLDDPTTTADESRYQKVGWGWAASFVDSKPNATTDGKFYLYSARFRTTAAYQTNNTNTYGSGNYFDVIEATGGTVNAYIITEFDMPALPTSKEDPAYGKTVTLYPADITDQFETEYEIGVTQGGTMYDGRIYYSYGWNGAPTSLYTRNGIQVFDIAEKRIVSKLALYNSELQSMEPECCSIWNGHLVLGLNGGGYQVYVFDYVALDEPTVIEPAIGQGGMKYIECALCGHNLKTLETYDPLPEPTTEAPEATTEAPEVTTEAPEVTTEAPEATTEAPEVTTEAPEATTEAPEATTEAPEATTEAPEATTEAPEATTEAPEATTEAPEATTEAPEVTTEAPETTTEAPEVTTEAPKVTTEAPEATIEAPETTTEAPEATVPEESKPEEVTEVTVKVLVPENWQNPCIWAWDNNGRNAFEAWPGLPLTKGADGYWYATIPVWVENVIINGSEGSVQTKDLPLAQTEVDVTVKVTQIGSDVKAEITYTAPDTGDDFEALPFILLMLLSAAGVAVLIFGRKRWFGKKK